MGHDKLRKFAENEHFSCLLQPSAEELLADGFFALRDHAVKGRWNEQMFDAARPIVLELGCGKGEYTVAMAKRSPERNYIGIDRKGARLWRGCKDALEQELANVAFLRITIDHIGYYFAPGEVDEIWVTFPDPQIKKERKRLVGSHFVNDYYRPIFPATGGILHLKSDSDFLYEYLLETAQEQQWKLLCNIPDVYAGVAEPLLTEVQTFYEKMWLAEGKTIHYVRLGIL